MRRWIPLVVVLSACGGDIKALEDARQKWLTEGSDTYTMTVTHTCFCPDTDPVEVDVVGSAVRGAIIKAPDGDVVVENIDFKNWYTVNGIFDEIEAAIDQNVHEVAVTYADKLGYPQDVLIDVEVTAADDDYGWTIANIKLDPAGVGTGGG